MLKEGSRGESRWVRWGQSTWQKECAARTGVKSYNIFTERVNMTSSRIVLNPLITSYFNAVSKRHDQLWMLENDFSLINVVWFQLPTLIWRLGICLEKFFFLIIPRFWSTIVCFHMEIRSDVIIVLLYIINFWYWPSSWPFCDFISKCMDIILSNDKSRNVSRNWIHHTW